MKLRHHVLIGSMILFCEVAGCLCIIPVRADNKKDAPAIKAEDALAISRIETQIEANGIQKAQLEAAYNQNLAQNRQLAEALKAADTAALKNAGADPEKFEVDHKKLQQQIVAKPPKPADPK